MDATSIIDALVKRRGNDIFATELSFSGGARRCDFWTISPNGSSGFRACAYEVKVSRQDFKRDSFEKQRQARLFSDVFYYVTPAGLLKKEEIPDWAGLQEWDGSLLRTVIPAPVRDKDGPSWEFVVSLIRNSGEVHRDTGLLKKRLFEAERKLKFAEKVIREKGDQPWQYGI